MQSPLPEGIDARIQAIVREVGAFTVDEFNKFEFDNVRYKSENDPFSFVDVQADEKLRAGCEALIPGAGFINEELAALKGENDWRWIIDPIDGTSNFTHGVPHYCISLALQYKEETLLGYIYQPVTHEMFRAEKGKGAWLNDKPIQSSKREEMRMALVSTGFPYAQEEWVRPYLEMIHKIMGYTHGLRRFGSAALDLAYVAAGRLDAFFEYNLKPWDVAAGSLIVREAGGTVSDFRGGENFLFGGEMLATNGFIHQGLLEIMGKSRLLSQNPGENR